MFRAGEAALADFSSELGHGVLHDGGEFCKTLHESGLEPFVQAQHVLQHQHLSTAVVAGPNADGRHRNGVRDGLGQGGRNPLKHHAENTRIHKGLGVLQQGRCGFLTAPLDFVSAEFVEGLGGKPQVPHDGDARFDQALHRFGNAASAFQFYRFGPAFLQQAPGVSQGLFTADLIGHKRHVGDQQRTLQATGHGAAVIDHVFQRNGQGRLVTLHHVAQRIADQHHVHAGLIDQPGESGVVGRDHDHTFACTAHASYPRHRHLVCVHWLLPTATGAIISANRSLCNVTEPWESQNSFDFDPRQGYGPAQLQPGLQNTLIRG